MPHIRPRSVGVVDKIRSDPHSSCVDDFWRGILGASRSLHVFGPRRGVSMTGPTVECSAELEELRRRPWAHMLGCRDHVSTKGRHDSTTLWCLRQPRQGRRTKRLVTALGYQKGPTSTGTTSTARRAAKMTSTRSSSSGTANNGSGAVRQEKACTGAASPISPSPDGWLGRR